MQFLPKSFHLTNVPVVRLCNETLNFSKKVKYLGVYLTNTLTDDNDINRQVRSLYCSANQLKSAFLHCSFDVKNLLFKSYERILQIFIVHICGVINHVFTVFV